MIDSLGNEVYKSNMPVINRHSNVPFSSAQMFSLVNDVAAYSEFLPWCETSKIISSDSDTIHASITVASHGIKKTFSTCNRLQQDKMIEISLLDGPFKHLHGFWRFDDLDGKGSRIAIDMEFEFAGKLLDFMIGPIFHQAIHSLIDAFCKRARNIYE